MMMMPRRNGFDIFDEVFNDPFFSNKENKLMKTDVKEKGDKYILDIDLPGFDKKDINIELSNGYVTIKTKRTENKDEKDTNYIYKERFFGECSRSYYVGENVKEEDIQATFKNGTLMLTFPKESKKQLENKKYIQIGD